MSESIGVINPGDMGVSIAASAVHNGHHVYWASKGRSADTRKRAEENHLIDVGSLEELCKQCPIILSVVPPSAAEEVAEQVIAQKFKGTFADLNAISSISPTHRHARSVMRATRAVALLSSPEPSAAQRRIKASRTPEFSAVPSTPAISAVCPLVYAP